MQEWPAGYQGEVVLDNETNKVLRLTVSADDIPKESGIDQSSVEVDYDFVEVAGTSHLLPSHSNSRLEVESKNLECGDVHRLQEI
jgi:hypothetical protein